MISTQTWKVASICNGKSTKEMISIVISCVGQLNNPKIPDIKDLDEFQGNMFHSSKWPDGDVIAEKKL